MRHRPAAIGAVVAALVLGVGAAGAVEDPGFATLDAVGEGTRVGFAAAVGRRRVVTFGHRFAGRFDLYGHAPLTSKFGLHVRAAAAYGHSAAFDFDGRRAPSSTVDPDEGFALYALQVGGSWLARAGSVSVPAALTLALPLSAESPVDQARLQVPLSARPADYPTQWPAPALRLSLSPAVDRGIARVRFDAGIDVPLLESDTFHFQLGVRAAAGVSATPGPVAFMVEGVWYGALGQFTDFGGCTVALGARWVGSALRPSLHMVLPVGLQFADEDVIWWMLGLDWAPPAASAHVRSDR